MFGCQSSQGCCGALHYHAAREDEALALARQNMSAFRTSGPDWDGLDAIVTNAAGCGAMLAEYPHAFHGKDGEKLADAFTKPRRSTLRPSWRN